MRLRSAAISGLLALALGVPADPAAGGPPGAAGPAPAAPPAAVLARPLSGVRPDSAALLTSGGEGGPVRMALLLLPGRGTAGPRLFVYVEIDGESLSSDLPDDAAGLELSTYVLDLGGSVVAHASEGLVLPGAGGRDELARGGLRYSEAFDLPPGDYSVRVLARARPAGGFGVQGALVRLSPVASTDAARPVALWPDSGGVWLEVRSPSLSANEPPRLPGSLWPSALPLATAVSGTRLLLALPEGRPPSPTLGARLIPLPAGDERMAGISAGVVAGKLGAGLEARAATLDLSGVPPGRYELQPASGLGAEGPGGTRIVVVPSGAAPLATWIEAARKGAGALGGARPALAPERAAERAGAVVELRKGLIAALAPLAAGGALETAVEAMLAVEVAALEEAPRRALDRLADAHTQMQAMLAGRDPEVLLPLSFAFARLAERAALARQPLLSLQAQETAARLAETFARQGPPEEAPHLAARLLLGLAGRFWDLGASRRAQKLLALADPLDPADGTAGLLAVLIHERYDERSEAAEALRKFLDRRPGDREARLRLGLTELTLGQPRGEGRLGELAQEPAADWVGAVATQELIRLELAGGRYDEAVRRAREGLQRYPADPALRLQLSWALQQSGRPAEAVAALEAELRETGAVPARRRYSAWPAEVLRAAQREAEEAAQLRLPALRAAIPPPAASPTEQAAPAKGSS